MQKSVSFLSTCECLSPGPPGCAHIGEAEPDFGSYLCLEQLRSLRADVKDLVNVGSKGFIFLFDAEVIVGWIEIFYFFFICALPLLPLKFVVSLLLLSVIVGAATH